MLIDMGCDWNHLLTLAAIGTIVLTGVLAAMCAAADLWARSDSGVDRKRRALPRITV